MTWTTLLQKTLGTFYGPLPEPPAAANVTGLVLAVDGVGGFHLCGTSLQFAVSAAGLSHLVCVHVWTHGPGRWYRDLTCLSRNREHAATLAAQVAAFRQKHPDLPIYLVGKSGGTGLVVWALEQLPPGSVQAVVLLAPALSPGYDLSRALSAVRGQMTVFWSPLDFVLLGAGTRVLGTIDRARTVAAGLVAFKQPPGADPAAYARLHQVRWRPRMSTSGNLGGHFGNSLPSFLTAYVVPLLTLGDETASPGTRASSPARAAPIT